MKATLKIFHGNDWAYYSGNDEQVLFSAIKITKNPSDSLASAISGAGEFMDASAKEVDIDFKVKINVAQETVHIETGVSEFKVNYQVFSLITRFNTFNEIRNQIENYLDNGILASPHDSLYTHLVVYGINNLMAEKGKQYFIPEKRQYDDGYESDEDLEDTEDTLQNPRWTEQVKVSWPIEDEELIEFIKDTCGEELDLGSEKFTFQETNPEHNNLQIEALEFTIFSLQSAVAKLQYDIVGQLEALNVVADETRQTTDAKQEFLVKQSEFYGAIVVFKYLAGNFEQAKRVLKSDFNFQRTQLAKKLRFYVNNFKGDPAPFQDVAGEALGYEKKYKLNDNKRAAAEEWVRDINGLIKRLEDAHKKGGGEGKPEEDPEDQDSEEWNDFDLFRDKKQEMERELETLFDNFTGDPEPYKGVNADPNDSDDGFLGVFTDERDEIEAEYNSSWHPVKKSESIQKAARKRWIRRNRALIKRVEDA